ncbi:MAG: dihydroorotate dehydrogenase electron transfer subunit, partial [Candidatus Aminicenantales bacterium]
MMIERHARLREVQIWGDHIHFAIDAPELGRGARPGQFVMVKVSEGTFPLLRRPLGIHEANAGGIELFFKVAGQGTELLSRKRRGDRLDIIGPLGKGFTIPESIKGRTAYLVGGGRGIAPLYFLARELVKAGGRPVVLYGGRCLTDIPLRDRFEKAG